MSQIEAYQGTGGGISRDVRRTARSMERSRSVTQVRNARIADEADVAIEKVEQVSYVTTTGMMAIARATVSRSNLSKPRRSWLAVSAGWPTITSWPWWR